MKFFKNLVFDIIKRDVTNSMLTLIDEERDGGGIDRELIRNCVEIFETMGMGELDIYQQDFEEHMLNRAKDYYIRKSSSWIGEDSLSVYLIKAEKCIADEKLRVGSYLNVDTEPKLLRVFDQEVLEKRTMTLLEKEGSGCKQMLANDMFDDLSRLFKLFSRFPDGLVPVAEIFKLFVSECGEEKIAQRIARLEGSPYYRFSSLLVIDAETTDNFCAPSFFSYLL